MTPIQDLLLTAWIAETPDGSEAVYLLVATTRVDAPVVMPGVAAAMGLDPAPGTVRTNVSPDMARVEVGADGWIHLRYPGDALSRPVDPEHAAMLRDQRRAVLVVGHPPLPAEVDTWAWVEAHGDRVSLGVITAV